jgi:hypothetical protein
MGSDSGRRREFFSTARHNIVVNAARTTAAAIAALFVAASAAPQTIRGTATSPAMPGGAPGVIVMLLDSASSPRVRALTGDRGEFLLHAPAPGAYRVRALRIGLAPLETDAFVVSTDTIVALRMRDVPLALPPITTSEQTQCRARPDSGLALAALWEDAKKALLATAVTPEAGAYRFDIVDHRRTYEFDSGELSSIALRELFINGAGSWSSRPAEELREHGYVRRDRDSTSFVAPDIQTLLADYFVDAHCFRLARHSAADTTYVIEFEPVPGISHVEVRGRLAIDAASHELRSLDFAYTNLDLPAGGFEAGGHVGFMRLDTGGWAIADWSIRIPTFRGTIADEMRITGGALRGVTRDGTPVWSRPISSIELRLDSASRIAGPAVAHLVGSTHAVAFDSSGSVSFDRLVEGSYLVDVGNQTLDILGWPRRRIRVDIKKPDHITENVRLDDALVAARAACGGDSPSISASTGVLIGNLAHANAAVIGKEVIVTWVGDPEGARSPGMIQRRVVRTLASDGRFYVCGVPRERPIEIRAASGDAAATAQLARTQVVGIVSLAIKP